MISSFLSTEISKSQGDLQMGQRVQLFLRYLASDQGLVPR